MVAAQWTLGKAFRSVSLICSLWHPRDGGVVVVLIGSAEFRRVWSPHWIFISRWGCRQTVLISVCAILGKVLRDQDRTAQVSSSFQYMVFLKETIVLLSAST